MAQIEERPEADRATKERVSCKLEDDLELRADGVVRRRGQLTAARPTDIPERTDLPKDHPLYGQRVARVVPSGMTDCVIGADGRLTPVGREDPKPVDDDLTEREAIDVTR